MVCFLPPDSVKVASLNEISREVHGMGPNRTAASSPYGREHVPTHFVIASATRRQSRKCLHNPFTCGISCYRNACLQCLHSCAECVLPRARAHFKRRLQIDCLSIKTFPSQRLDFLLSILLVPLRKDLLMPRVTRHVWTATLFKVN